MIDDGRAAGFLTGVAGLRHAGVPAGAGDVERLTVALGLARGVHVAMFAPVGGVAAPDAAPATLRGRAALLAGLPVDRVVVGGGAAAAIRGAGLDALAARVERAEAETGLLLMAPRALFETAGGLDPAMDDGADLALLDFALRARAAGAEARVLEDRLWPRSAAPGPMEPRAMFAERWK